MIVLDRPNPIGGAVQGNVLDPAYRVDRRPHRGADAPRAHPGRAGAARRGGPRAAVADASCPLGGWRRTRRSTPPASRSCRPSPNLRSLEALFHYPGLCLFEGTALSVGRGSDAPFEQIGAPWLDTAAVLPRLAAAGLPGVRFQSVSFTPRAPGDGRFADTLVAGIRLAATDRAAYDPTRTAVHLLSAVQAVHPDRIGWIPRHFDRLAGGPALREAILAGHPPASIADGWQRALAEFDRRAGTVRLYP